MGLKFSIAFKLPSDSAGGPTVSISNVSSSSVSKTIFGDGANGEDLAIGIDWRSGVLGTKY